MSKVTMQDIADALGTSRVTVWKTFNHRPGVSDEMKEKIIAKAHELGYDKLPSEDLCQSKVARDPGKKGAEPIRALVRHRVPCAHPSIIDALLGIFAVFENVICNDVAVTPIFPLGFRYGLL